MRSATSYFNPTLYRKTMARFWPLWAMYGVIWLFLVPLNLLNSYLSHDMSQAGTRQWLLDQALDIPYTLDTGLFLSVVFGVLCAMAVFGYLYNSRSTCMMHALPLRREALFTTQYLAGLSFLLLPQLAAALLAAMTELAFIPSADWGKALGALLTWLLAQSGTALFFFSFAAFCAMFTGHILALPAFYGILNVLVMGVSMLLDTLLQGFFYGYTGMTWNGDLVLWLTPAAHLESAVGWVDTALVSAYLTPEYTIQRTGEYVLRAPAAVAVYAAAGVVLALVSLAVYRRRHAETAGDVVAVPLVRPVFKYGVSLCAGLAFGEATTAFFGWDSPLALALFLVVWAVAGYFAAEMLLKKSFRVLRAWRGAAVVAGVLVLLCVACVLDLFQVVHKVPTLDQVESVQVNVDMGYPYDSGNWLAGPITDPAQLQLMLDLHRAIVDEGKEARVGGVYRSEQYDTTGTIYLSYTLTNGRRLVRRYQSLSVCTGDLEREGSITWALQNILQDRALVERAYGLADIPGQGRITEAWLDRLVQEGVDRPGDSYTRSYESVYLDSSFVKPLWEAVQQDFAEGNLGTRYLFDLSPERQNNTYVTDLEFGISGDVEVKGSEGSTAYASRTFTVTLTPQARHTLAVLEQTGIWDEGYTLETQAQRYAQN